jgi:hypothetical protein
MGLGPPVCMKCMVIGNLSEEKGWFCEICDSRDLKGNLWNNIGVSEDELESNYRFYKAVKDGKE